MSNKQSLETITRCMYHFLLGCLLICDPPAITIDMAPEMLNRYDFKADSDSLSNTMFNLLFDEHAPSRREFSALVSTPSNLAYFREFDETRPSLDRNAELRLPSLQRLISASLAQDPQQRPMAPEVLERLVELKNDKRTNKRFLGDSWDNIPPEDTPSLFTGKPLLGLGAYSTGTFMSFTKRVTIDDLFLSRIVYLGEWKGKPAAIKRIFPTPNAAQQLSTELILLQNIKSPCLVNSHVPPTLPSPTDSIQVETNCSMHSRGTSVVGH